MTIKPAFIGMPALLLFASLPCPIQKILAIPAKTLYDKQEIYELIEGFS